jgi:hypothetical protein
MTPAIRRQAGWQSLKVSVEFKMYHLFYPKANGR